MTAPQNSSVPILIETLSRGFFPMLRCHYLVVDFGSRGIAGLSVLASQSFRF
jgi:hypothetical protein